MPTFMGDLSTAIGFVLGALVGAVTALFFSAWSATKERRSRAELELQWDKAGLGDRGDLSPTQKEIFEIKIDRGFARELEKIDRKADVISKLLSWFSVIGGATGLFLALYKFISAYSERLGEILMPSAYAATPIRENLSPFLPYVFMSILFIMGAAFVIAVIVQFTLPDTRENHSRIRAADNIVKTFGGFFTGLATTLLS